MWVSDADVPVTVTVYAPAGVPGTVVPPPPEDELPPHAAMKISPENSMHPSRKPSHRFLRDVNPAPTNASPPTGSHIA